MKKLSLLLLITVVVLSCTKISENPYSSFLTGSGVFIINEGNFRAGNGSLSFYSYDSLKIYNDLFQKINGRPLGDVPNSMTIIGERAYIVVNNSGKVEIINKSTLESEGTISGLISPRNIARVNDRKAYITSMYSDSIAIVDLADNSISGYINIKHSSEAIFVIDNKAFVSSWVGGSKLIIINTINDIVSDSVTVGVGPESMVIDKNKKLWILCDGGWSGINSAELIKLNTVSNSVEKKFVFPVLMVPPSCLRIDGAGENLFYLESGVRNMNIDASSLPSAAFISEPEHYFYKMDINPVNSDIFITDAVDYQQQGFVMCYKKDGTFISSLKADIIPGVMCFKLNDNFDSK